MVEDSSSVAGADHLLKFFVCSLLLCFFRYYMDCALVDYCFIYFFCTRRYLLALF